MALDDDTRRDIAAIREEVHLQFSTLDAKLSRVLMIVDGDPSVQLVGVLSRLTKVEAQLVTFNTEKDALTNQLKGMKQAAAFLGVISVPGIFAFIQQILLIIHK